MNRNLEEGLHAAAHTVLHSETGKEAVKAVGATVIAMATPLLATPAAPIVIGGLIFGGAYFGAKKLLDWLN
jgi:hypothetical protein